MIIALRKRNYYKNETDQFIKAVKEVSGNGIPVVLPRTIRFDEEQKIHVEKIKFCEEHKNYIGTNKFCETFKKILEIGKEISCKIPVVRSIIRGVQNYLLEPAIFDERFKGNMNVKEGYISLPYDMRWMPPVLKIKNATNKNATDIDSFSIAIVRAIHKEALIKDLLKVDNSEEKGYMLHYGSYIRGKDFKYNIFNSGDIVKENIQNWKQKLADQVVIVGGVWHKLAYQRGDPIDIHLIPVEEAQGVHIHANYVEAMLDSRIYKPWGEWFVKVIGFVSAFLIAMALRLKAAPFLTVIFIRLFLLLFSYLLLQNIGTIFDFFIPVLVIFIHFEWEQIHEQHKKAIEYDKQRQAEEK